MKKTMQLIIMVLLAESCAFGDNLRINEADNGKTNAVAVGTDIVITLPGNPTTGYEWGLQSCATNRIERVGEAEYQQAEAKDKIPRVGVGGSFTFKFKAVSPGQGEIKLIYRRSWETNADDKVYSVVLDVK